MSGSESRANASAAAGLRLLAPTKINLAFEVIGRREDGYHDIDTVMTTLDLADEITLCAADQLDVRIEGEFADGIVAGADLAGRAARALAEAAARAPNVRIDVTKRVPHPAGLGGGSSDAAAVLRGLNVLWELRWPAERLAEIGASIGADVPFFIYGGTARCTGRGEQVQPLRDLRPLRLLIAVAPLMATARKTARRYAALEPRDMSDGTRSQRLARRIARGAPPPAADLVNAFEGVVERTDAELVGQLDGYRAAGAAALHLCGAGPAAYVIVEGDSRLATLRRGLRKAGAAVFATRTLRRDDALAVQPLVALPDS